MLHTCWVLHFTLTDYSINICTYSIIGFILYNEFKQRDREGKGLVFTTTLIARSKFKAHANHVVASLDKTPDDDYSAWWLRTSNKFGGQEFEEIHRSIGLSKTPNQVRIPPSTL